MALAEPQSVVISFLTHQPGSYSVEVLIQPRELTSCSLEGISSHWLIVVYASTNKGLDLQS